MKNTSIFFVFLLQVISSFGQEITKEEVGNTEYLSEQIVDKKQTSTLFIDYGKVSLSKINLKPGDYKKSIAILKLNGKKIPSRMTQNGNQYEISWRGANLKAGNEIEVLIKSI